MKLETKFNVGDSVWFMLNNKPKLHEVQEIKITKTKMDIKIIIIPFNLAPVSESRCFSSKQELINSL